MFKMTFTTTNDAFVDFEVDECLRILESIKAKLCCGFREGSIRDINGNVIGEWSL